MNIIVREDLKAWIDPLTTEEYEALERSLLTEGCRDALVLWGETLVDGHNRHAICTKHGIPFRTLQNPRFRSLEDVQLWMIDQHLGRRSVSDFQRGVLALRKREILAERKAQGDEAGGAEPGTAEAAVAAAAITTDGAELIGGAPGTVAPPPAPLDSREALARAARLSPHQVALIEKIQQQAAPEVVAAVRNGSLSINAAAAVASLPAQEQVAAASAGAGELKLAARRVRDAKRAAREALSGGGEATAGLPEGEAPAGDTAADKAAQKAADKAGADALALLPLLRSELAALQSENAALKAENAALKAQAQGRSAD